MTYTLAATKGGTGTGTITGNGLSCGSTCSVTVTSGTVVNLTATPNSDSTFDGWTAVCTGTGACSTGISANTIVSASFSLIPVTPPAGGGSGGGGGGSGGGGGGGTVGGIPSTGTLTPTVYQPAPASIPVASSCITTTISPFTRSLTLGSTGSDVKALQAFLNSKGFKVAVSGPGSPGLESTYFGPATSAALSRFQITNRITPALGYFGPLTMAKANELSTGTKICTTATPTPTVSASFVRDLTIGSTGSDVRSLQVFLNTHGYQVALSGNGSPGHESTYFGPATQSALSRFQSANGIIPASGYFGPKTRAKIGK